jgi:Cellulase (glycosyl hydrolase family 5)
MSRVSRFVLVLVGALVAPIVQPIAAQAPAPPSAGRWSEARAAEWYRGQPWLVGANYTPASAINQLEMWQADTFDPARIDRELGWAQGIGMNTMRVFLHDLLWQQDAAGFTKRIEQFLAIADRHHVKPLFVLFDSCWDPLPVLGTQHAPTPGVHNSGWVQGPGAKALQDPAEHARLETYVKGVVAAFAKDRRVLGWDVWNEPDNGNGGSYKDKEPQGKQQLVIALLPRVFAWARSAKPTQPLTSGVWTGDWSSEDKMSETARIQVANSDVVSFHNYDDGAELEKRIGWLKRLNRPLLCTEYMARGNKSTFAGSLPVLERHGIAAYNWGLVVGKTQTNLPWDSWRKPYTDREPEVWFHEVFRADGTPYRADETDLIKKLTAARRKAA